VATRSVLQSLSRTEVIICEWPPPLSHQYFKVVLLDVPLTRCHSCNKIFHKDDYELLALQQSRCPYCRTSIDDWASPTSQSPYHSSPVEAPCTHSCYSSLVYQKFCIEAGLDLYLRDYDTLNRCVLQSEVMYVSLRLFAVGWQLLMLVVVK